MDRVAPAIYKEAADTVSVMLGRQAQAISDAAKQLDPEAVRRAVQLLHSASGKAVVAGVGKSGIVAQKIAATFTSTGTPAVALQPGQAMHGDLGIVGQGDVAVLISNSGQTPELLNLLPHLKTRGVTIVAIVGQTDSPLAEEATVVLAATVASELDANNLAPTASTAVSMAIGDALAMTVMEARGFTPEQFARNHPAGALGKRLTLRVADVMRTGKHLPVVNSTDSWLDVLAAISGGGVGTVCVVDRNQLLLGIITDGDLRRILQRTDLVELGGLRAADIMTRDPLTTTQEQMAYDAMQLMNRRHNQVATLPVLDEGGRCIGLLRLHDVIQSGLA